ncbi:carbohydrate-binding family 9-like protein [Paludisphaera rhizosphaerae]|uniref:carbohydrate-binding family 9-like protein n=1 Tax=Paludisphaera rhizosphaerae TaxID=2711216 RepID=UPI0013EBF5B7|nr:carbohydrate-binding family 9-like protein [Paludisphaera rhizosphaerae]
MKRLSTLPALFLFLVGSAFAEPPTTKNAECRRAVEPPKLDGKLDDRCWRDAKPITEFAAFWIGESRPGTKAMLAWDDEFLYYAGEMSDAELRASGRNRNDHLWEGDVFEMFFKPRDDQPAYYEFQANPLASVFEVAFPKRGPLGHAFNQEPVLGNEAVVALQGTLDRPGDIDEGWTVEGRIPWKAFTPTGGRPKSGDAWKFAICRYDYGAEGTKPTTMSSAPLTLQSFHRFEDYGVLKFVGP